MNNNIIEPIEESNNEPIEESNNEPIEESNDEPNEESNDEPNEEVIEEEFNTELYLELFGDLFAYRFYLLDIYNTNEREIIKKLKIKVFHLGYNIDNINSIVFNFYKYYNINVLLEEIENVTILILLPLLSPTANEPINTTYNLNNINDLLINIFGSDTNALTELAMSIRNRMNNTFEDVKITLDESELEKLKTYTLTKTLEEKCVICIGELEEGEHVMELPCKHIFHHNCIKSLLLNYDYKCPVCRHDIGKHKINL